MKTFNTVIFDLEDTMYPRRQYIHSGCRAVSKYMSSIYGMECHKELEEACSSTGIHTAMTMTFTKLFNNVDTGLINRLLHVWRCHTPLIQLYQDVRIALAILRNMNMRLGVISKDLPDVQETKMAALELQDLLDSAFYGSDDDGADTMENAFHLLEVLAETSLNNVVFVGNGTTSDFETPRSLGVATVCISRVEQPTSSPAITPSRADMTITSMMDLHDSINRLEELRKVRAS